MLEENLEGWFWINIEDQELRIHFFPSEMQVDCADQMQLHDEARPTRSWNEER